MKTKNSKFQIPINNYKLKYGPKDNKIYKLSIPGNVI